MRINFIVPEIVRSGGIRVIFEYANRLKEKGHDVMVYTPIIPFNPFTPEFRSYFIKHQLKYALRNITGVKRLPKNIFEHNFTIRHVPAVNNLFIRNADAVIASSWTTSYYVNNLKKSKGRKFYLIQDYEIWNCNEETAKNSYRLPLEKVVISDYLKELLLEKFGERSVKILDSVNFELFDNPDKKFNKPVHILFSDHLLSNKNTKGAVSILEKIKKDHPDTRISCFGVNMYNEIPDYVEFSVNPDDKAIRDLYCSADIFLYTSLYEGFATMPAEAMACKCAVVSNKIGAVPEYAEHMSSAILADPENPRELLDGLEYLINNPPELKRISQNGYDRVREVLSWDRSVNELEELVKNKSV